VYLKATADSWPFLCQKLPWFAFTFIFDCPDRCNAPVLWSSGISKATDQPEVAG
jgi:hypothetical protein